MHHESIVYNHIHFNYTQNGMNKLCTEMNFTICVVFSNSRIRNNSIDLHCKSKKYGIRTHINIIYK